MDFCTGLGANHSHSGGYGADLQRQAGRKDAVLWFKQHETPHCLYTERLGHPMLRARHLPFKIGILKRDQWLACMDQAMGETGVDDALRKRLQQSFFQTADWMRNVGV